MVGFGMRSINDSFRYHAAMSAVASWGEVFQEKGRMALGTGTDGQLPQLCPGGPGI